MTLYLDTSAIVPLFVREPAGAHVLALLDGNPEALSVSEFAAGEFASAMSRLVRTGQLPIENGHASLAAFDAWRAAVCRTAVHDTGDIGRAALLVRRFDLKLRMPDALHAAICERLGHTLVTFDRRLADAASVLGVAVVLPP